MPKEKPKAEEIELTDEDERLLDLANDRVAAQMKAEKPKPEKSPKA